MDEAVLAIWHAQQVRAWTADLIAIFEKSLADAGLLTPLPTPAGHLLPGHHGLHPPDA